MPSLESTLHISASLRTEHTVSLLTMYDPIAVPSDNHLCSVGMSSVRFARPSLVPLYAGISLSRVRFSMYSWYGCIRTRTLNKTKPSHDYLAQHPTLNAYLILSMSYSRSIRFYVPNLYLHHVARGDAGSFRTVEPKLDTITNMSTPLAGSQSSSNLFVTTWFSPPIHHTLDHA